MLEPQGGAELPITSAPAIMDQAGYEFLPAFLIAQAGQPVQFRNSEDVLHNVRVSNAAPPQEPVFNVATLAFGKHEHKFQPGYYNVTCDIHSTMRASIFVTASPYTATTAADGRFSLSNVLPGQYNLTIYAGAAPVVRPVEIKSGADGSWGNTVTNNVKRKRQNVTRARRPFLLRFSLFVSLLGGRVCRGGLDGVRPHDLINQEQIGEQRSQVDRRVEVVDHL